jgi:hypothetical protein
MAFDAPEQQDTQNPPINPVLQAVQNVANPPVGVVQPSPLAPAPAAQPAQDEDEPNFGERTATGLADILSDPRTANAAFNSPSGWAKSVLLATTRAAAGSFGDKLASAVGGFGQDAAAGMAQPAGAGPKGSGALKGIADTLAAHGQRVAQQKQQQFNNSIESQKAADEHARAQAMIAHENIATLHDQYLLTKMDADDQQRSVTTGKMNLQPYIDAHGEVIKQDIDGDEAKALVASGHLDPTQQHIFPTGFSSDKKNPNGTPVMTYTVVGNVPELEVTADNAAFINKYTGQKLSTDPENLQKLPGLQYGSLVQSAVSAQTALDSINAQRRKNDLDEYQGKLSAEQQTLLPDWNRWLATTHNDPINALAHATADPETAKKYPNMATIVMGMYGGPKEWETMTNDRAKQADKGENVVDTVFKNPDKIDSEEKAEAYLPFLKAAQNSASTQEQRDRANQAYTLVTQIKNNIAADKAGVDPGGIVNVPMTKDMRDKIDALKPDERAVLQTAPKNQQAALMSVAFGDGDFDLNTFPVSPRKGTGILSRSEAQNTITQINPDWTPQQYKIKQEAYKEATSSRPGSLGAQADSLNNFIGHAAEAQSINKFFYNNDPKIFKGTLSAVEKMGYGTNVVKLQEAINVVNGEFQNMVLSGHVPSTAEKDAQATLVSSSSTVGQINAALDVMAHMAQTRADTMNGHYRRSTGSNFPNLISAENQDNAQALGINTSKYNVGGRVGFANSGQQGGGKPPALPQAPAGKIAVQIPGSPVGFISQSALPQFKKDHPNAVIGQ